MSFTHSSLGIDLREDKVVVSHLRRSLKGIRVTRSAVLPLTPGKGKEEREAEIINAVQGYISGENLPKENVVLSLPREKALVKLAEVPAAAKENLRKVLEYELVKYVPFPPEEAAFDYQVLGESSGFVRVLLVIIRRDDLNEALELFKRMGIRPMAVEIPTTASANLFFYDERPGDERPFVLMDVGKRFFGFDFFEKGGLRESFHFTFREESGRAKELAEAFRSVSLRGGGAENGKAGVWAFGEEANAVLVNELIQDLSPDTHLIQGLKKLEFEEAPQKLAESYTSIGLALRGLRKARWTLNLLPLTLRKKVSRIGVYLAVLLTAAALALAGIMVVRPVLEEREDLKQVLAKVKEKKPEIEAVDVLQKKKEQTEKEVLDFVALRGEETRKVEVLRELAEILPATAWIWNIKVKSRDVELNGFADSAADLISILDKSPVFEKVEFSAPVVKETRLFGDKVKERFKISARIERSR